LGFAKKVNKLTRSMTKPVVEAEIYAVAPIGSGFAVFLGNQEKAFVISVDQSVGSAIAMFMEGTPKGRPITHDLMLNILRELGAKVERAIISEIKAGTCLARLVLSVANERNQKKIVELDARPSDCIAMAIAQRAPIYVSLQVWNQVEDMTETLRKIQKAGPRKSGKEVDK
jgi:bifunctional DNase/RNase